MIEVTPQVQNQEARHMIGILGITLVPYIRAWINLMELEALKAQNSKAKREH